MNKKLKKENPTICSYSKRFSVINTELLNSSEEEFELACLQAEMYELSSGFKCVKRGNVAPKGTEFHYEPIISAEDYDAFVTEMKGKVDQYNAKFGTELFVK